MKNDNDYKKWSEIKISINKREDDVLCYKERDIWWCLLGLNIGSEQDGKNDKFERPVIVFRQFGSKILWVIPLTTKLDESDSRINYTFTCGGITRTAVINQLRLISSKRLLRYIDTISFYDFQKIRKYLADLI